MEYFSDAAPQRVRRLCRLWSPLLNTALKAPKEALGFAEHDTHVAGVLWAKLDSSEVQDWHVYRLNNPQYEERSQMKLFADYFFLASRPENQYHNEELRQRHDDFMQALTAYRATVARQMVPTRSNFEQLVISVKRYAEDGEREDYDKKYRQQVGDVLDALDTVWNKWSACRRLPFASRKWCTRDAVARILVVGRLRGRPATCPVRTMTQRGLSEPV